MIDELVDDFDFKSNDMDRRFFFEVTGRKLVEDEFDDLDSSDEEWALLQAPDPLAHAFSYAGYEGENKESQVALIGNSGAKGEKSAVKGKYTNKIN